MRGIEVTVFDMYEPGNGRRFGMTFGAHAASFARNIQGGHVHCALCARDSRNRSRIVVVVHEPMIMGFACRSCCRKYPNTHAVSNMILERIAVYDDAVNAAMTWWESLDNYQDQREVGDMLADALGQHVRLPGQCKEVERRQYAELISTPSARPKSRRPRRRQR